MSFYDIQDLFRDTQPPHHFQGRKRIVRRYGACIPCKKAKTRCDGGLPCLACRTQKRKPRQCDYSAPVQVRRALEAESRRKDQALRRKLDVSDDWDSCTLLSGHTSPQAGRARGDASGTSWTSVVADSRRPDDPSPLMCGAISAAGLFDEFVQARQVPESMAPHFHRFLGLNLLDDDRSSTCTSSTSEASFSTPDSETSDSPPTTIVSFGLLQPQLEVVRSMADEGKLGEALALSDQLAEQIFASVDPSSVDLDLGTFFSSVAREVVADVMQLNCRLSFVMGEQVKCADRKILLLERLYMLDKANRGRRKAQHELFRRTCQLLQLDMSTDEGVDEFLGIVFDIQRANGSSMIQSIAHRTAESDPADAQVFSIHANLFLMVVHCRLVSIGDHYSREGQDLPPSERKRKLIMKMNLHLPRQKETQCAKVLRSSKLILEAYERLSRFRQAAAARCWSACHPALIAMKVISFSKMRIEETWEGAIDFLDRSARLFRSPRHYGSDSPLLRSARKHINDCRCIMDSVWGLAGLHGEHLEVLHGIQTRTPSPERYRWNETDADLTRPSVLARNQIERKDFAPTPTSRKRGVRETEDSLVPSPTPSVEVNKARKVGPTEESTHEERSPSRSNSSSLESSPRSEFGPARGVFIWNGRQQNPDEPPPLTTSASTSFTDLDIDDERPPNASRPLSHPGPITKETAPDFQIIESSFSPSETDRQSSLVTDVADVVHPKSKGDGLGPLETDHGLSCPNARLETSPLPTTTTASGPTFDHSPPPPMPVVSSPLRLETQADPQASLDVLEGHPGAPFVHPFTGLQATLLTLWNSSWDEDYINDPSFVVAGSTASDQYGATTRGRPDRKGAGLDVGPHHSIPTQSPIQSQGSNHQLYHPPMVLPLSDINSDMVGRTRDVNPLESVTGHLQEKSPVCDQAAVLMPPPALSATLPYYPPFSTRRRSNPDLRCWPAQISVGMQYTDRCLAHPFEVIPASGFSRRRSSVDGFYVPLESANHSHLHPRPEPELASEPEPQVYPSFHPPLLYPFIPPSVHPPMMWEGFESYPTAQELPHSHGRDQR